MFRLIGEGISTREISQRLDLSMKTVDAHRRHMREKLNLRSTSELIRYATQWVSDRGGAPGLSHGSRLAARPLRRSQRLVSPGGSRVRRASQPGAMARASRATLRE